MVMRIDAAHCLAHNATVRCAVLSQREELMRLATINDRGPWGEDFDPRPSCAGRSLVGKMEDRLDELVVQLMQGGVSDPGLLSALKGEMRGITHCIALVRTPYAPDDEAVKNAAMDRYRARLSVLTVPA